MIRYILSLTESKSKCDGQLSEKESQECCSESNTCDIGEGDCDKDSECTGNLVCGTDNCYSIFGHGSKTLDCCEKGETLVLFMWSFIEMGIEIGIECLNECPIEGHVSR